MDRETAEVAPEKARTIPGDNGQEEQTIPDRPAESIWVVNNRSHATLRSRFYKSILLGVSCVFQIIIAGGILEAYGPLTFTAFTFGVVICAGIAAQEMGALLSAIDMNAQKLKEALFGPDEETPREEQKIKRPRTGAQA